MNFAAVAFDLDDTLYPHEQYVLGAYADVAEAARAAWGVPGGEFLARIAADWRRRTSRCTSIFKDALAAWGVADPGAEARLVGVYREHRPALAPHPGVEEGLGALRGAGLRLGLLSDGQPGVQRRKLAALGLEDSFDAVVVTGDLGRDFYKPAPEGYAALARALGLAPERVVYVGDNPRTDFPGARALGMGTLRVRGGEYAAEDHDPGQVDRAFDTIAQAMAWLLAEAGREAQDA